MDLSGGLSVRGLTVARAGRLVLEDVSFSAQEGRITCVLGQAGSGKTTLLAAIAGLLPPERGAVFRGGTEITRQPARRRGVGFLPPGTALPEARGVGAALRRLAGRGQAAPVDRRMAALGLAALSDRPAGILSHGQAALALAAARMGAPLPGIQGLGIQGQMLLLDEAGQGLDDDAQRRLLALLCQEAASGRVVLIAARTPSLALAADHLVLVGAGRVLQAGAPASLYAEPRDVACALLTGPANILQGTVRELRPGGFVWSAGSRHVQATAPDVRRPVLGSPVTLCLRPERLALMNARPPDLNAVDGAVVGLRTSGPLLDLSVDTPLGVLHASVPSWGTSPYPAIGQAVRLGWTADAATVLD